ncbi:MAG: hypothetical protein WAW39_03125, partial [Prosthecobacter sp.]|uniref:hypothetical protein n=1 Tax=Prosthecobacter sp. TaxID=1965333 RepID=UPI003BAE46F9
LRLRCVAHRPRLNLSLSATTKTAKMPTWKAMDHPFSFPANLMHVFDKANKARITQSGMPEGGGDPVFDITGGMQNKSAMPNNICPDRFRTTAFINSRV